MARTSNDRAASAAAAGSAGDLGTLKAAALGCRSCELWRLGSQTVFGEGAQPARIMLIGEQPGDREDRMGRPFVGPAGHVLRRALADAEIDSRHVYMTNVVKHFRWSARGKRRIHQRPAAEHIEACRPWLDAEVRLVAPQVLVCLGATAAQALLGSTFRVTRDRGKQIPSPLAQAVFATVHPSSILRMADAERDRAYEEFVTDLRIVAAAAGELRRPA